MFSMFPLIKKYLSGTTASSLDEARLGSEEFGGEVHFHDGRGRIIVTLEEENDHVIVESLQQFQNIEGVLAVHMVYHEIDDTEAG